MSILRMFYSCVLRNVRGHDHATVRNTSGVASAVKRSQQTKTLHPVLQSEPFNDGVQEAEGGEHKNNAPSTSDFMSAYPPLQAFPYHTQPEQGDGASRVESSYPTIVGVT